MDCGLWCVFSERRRHVEKLWRRRLLVTADERRARRRFLRLMRGFDAEDVEVLRKAVETDGLDAKQCAPGPPMDERPEEEPQVGQLEEDSGLIPQIDRPMSMPYLCCKMWRWKDLQVDAALHRLEALPWCRFGRVTINNATVSCCNPYHYALWIRPEVSSNDDESLEEEAEDRPMGNGHLVQPAVPQGPPDLPPDAPPACPPPSLPHEEGSLLLQDLDSPGPSHASASVHHQAIVHAFLAKQKDGKLVQAWARLDRWQKRERVGETVPLTGQFAAVGHLAASVHDAQNVVHEFDTKNEVSFALIRQSDPIGSANPEDVWLYNSGTRPLFLAISNSPHHSTRPEHLRRLTPGYCVRVHKGEAHKADEETDLRKTSPREFFPSQLIISVGKGWGPNYQRLYVTDTPIRYEVTFAPDS